MVSKQYKNCTLLWRFGHFTWLTKNAKIAIFQFSTRFLKTFPSTDMGPLYLKKIVKPSSTRKYPKPAWLPYSRLSNSPRKVYPMWRDSRYTTRHFRDKRDEISRKKNFSTLVSRICHETRKTATLAKIKIGNSKEEPFRL